MTRRAKIKSVGVCDLCGGPIPRGEWYTSKGAPRLHCSIECRQTANSRAGNPKRIEKLRQAIARGEWKNPRALMTPEEISAAHEGGYVLAGIVLMIIALVIWAALTGTLKP